MRKLWVRLIVLAGAVFVLIPEIAMAAKEKVTFVVVAHTTKLAGMQALWANIYNDDPILFTVITGVAIPLFGASFGVLADRIMHYSGIDLRTRELAEK